MNRKELSQKDKGKRVSATELKKKEKECRKIQQELTQVGLCCFNMTLLITALSASNSYCIC